MVNNESTLNGWKIFRAIPLQNGYIKFYKHATQFISTCSPFALLYFLGSKSFDQFCAAVVGKYHHLPKKGFGSNMTFLFT